jgi:IS1 transposase
MSNVQKSPLCTGPAKASQRRELGVSSAIVGDPNPLKDCTSCIERANLTVRTHCKRLARLTLAFSKKLNNFKAAIALHLAYYNFVKTYGSLRCTPAMETGIEKNAWTVSDLVNAA